MKKRTGRVSYGRRAFHQDASDAMGGDVIRGLIELITNCDDAYGDSAGKGSILVEVEHRRGPWRVIVRDRACGMSSDDMETKLVRLGGRTSGFERGANVRGNLGRGAKDLAAFGEVAFESIHNRRYSKLILKPTGDYEIEPDRKVTPALREALGIIRGNGTVVTLSVDGNAIRCPRHSTVKKKLEMHFQLRDILSDSAREVKLSDMRVGAPETLRYDYPEGPVVFQGPLDIDGYPDAKATLEIRRHPERCDGPPSDPSRPHGILVTGRRAIYENTLFGLESNPHAGWFSGRVRCEYIDLLAMDYDQRLEAGDAALAANPMPIITRRRDGLQHGHPFFVQLARAAEGPLRDLVDAEEKRAREQGAVASSRTRKALDKLGRDLSRAIDEDLREIEEEGLVGGFGSKGSIPAIRLIPEQVVSYVAEDKTLTVHARVDLGCSEVRIDLEPQGVVELIDGPTVTLEPHKKREELLVGQIRIRPLVENEATLLEATCGEHSTVAFVEVYPEREDEEEEIIPPDALEFERESYRVAWKKKRRIRLQAPAELIASEGVSFRVNSSDAGVVALGGGGEFVFDDARDFYVADVTIEARKLGAKTTLEVVLGGANASCTVYVAREEEAPGLRIEFDDNPDVGARRAIVDRDGGQAVIRIQCNHPSVLRYLGPGPEHLGQHEAISRAVIAEIVAGEAARMVVERKFGSGAAAGDLDAASLYYEHVVYFGKYIARCHRSFVPEQL